MTGPARVAAVLLVAMLVPGVLGAAPAPGRPDEAVSGPAAESAGQPSAESVDAPPDAGPTSEVPVPSADPADAGPELTPRARYNRGLERIRADDWEGAAAQFLQARDEAGPDPELRYRAAFNLGVALARLADEGQEERPEEAIGQLRQSAAWFQDAIRLAAESDDDARYNLEVVLRRIQLLADRLNQGNRLEARLDRVIDDQRGLRDRIRRLLQTVEAEGVAADPFAFQEEFDDLATLERTLQAEIGSISDLAGDERVLIEDKPEEERSDPERFRAVQLQNLEHYLQRARQSTSDTRRRLRRLEGERAHRRADAALAELKRAREQLLDPVTVLRSLARDQTELLVHTRALDALSAGRIRLGDDRPQSPPAWLTVEHLTEQQQAVSSRTDEILARLEAGVGSGDDTATSEASPEDSSPDRERLLRAAGEALPFLRDARDAMDAVLAAFASVRLDDAAEEETLAIRALLQAVERFAGVRELIDLAYRDQAGVVELLTPPADDEGAGEFLAELSTEERVRLVREAVEKNGERLERLEGMLQEERQRAEAQASQAVDPNAPADAESPDPAAVRERFETAERLRRQAADHLAELSGGLAAAESGGSAEGVLVPARSTLDDLERLRRLFFDLVEHLKELLLEQAETYDTTATLQFEADAEGLDLGLEPAARRQQDHATTGAALARAVDRQADAAAAGGDPHAQQASETLNEAAGEVHAAAGSMDDATYLLNEAVGQYAEESCPDLEPVLEEQLEAMAHLENAIRLLQPPRQQQDRQQQQQQRQQPQPQEDEMSRRQAERRLQAIREREAERQRDRSEAQQPEPVEKDW